VSPVASPPEVDPRLRCAVELLNRLPGATTRASCQGKTPSDPGTHAHLAYVLFAEPMPLTLEDRLLDDLGEIGRVEPDGVHCRWPERNEELCARLEESVRRRGSDLAAERWEHATIAIADIERGLAARILGERGGAVGWCLDCRTIDDPSRHETHRCFALVRAGEEHTLTAFAAYLAQHPPGPQLVEREGARAVLERVRHGDFGDSYRQRWRRFAADGAARALREDVRAAARGLRTVSLATDAYFEGSRLVLSARPLA
jgi:hypothetical protein